MIPITYEEKCYALLQGQCVVLEVTNCTECPFYKPVGCEDWVRLDIEGLPYLLSPEDYEEWRQGL